MDLKRTSSDDEEDSLAEIDNWSEQEETPSKRAKNGGPGQRNGTPSRQAATKASATIADASAQLISSDSPAEDDAETPPPACATVTPTPRKSIFGDVSGSRPPQPPQEQHQSSGDHGLDSSAFAGNGHDAFFGTEQPPTHAVSFYEEDIDGEF
jgi:hypothetical protein